MMNSAISKNEVVKIEFLRYENPENRGNLCNMMCREILTFNFGGNGTVDQLNEKYNL